MTEKEKREKERLIEKKESLAKTEEDLNEQESKARQEVEAADELLNDATSKLQDALSSTNLSKNSVTVAKMMLETAKTKHKEALEQLDKIRKKQKTVDKKTHDLLDEALPSEDVTQTKRKSEAEEKSVKEVKRK